MISVQSTSSKTESSPYIFIDLGETNVLDIFFKV